MGKKSKSESVQVIVRCRPKNKREIAEQGDMVVELDFASGSVHVKEHRSFAFDSVYDNRLSQRDLFNQSIMPVVDTVLQGYNSTIFAYGQSGSGKTHSVVGDLHSKEGYGIIPNSLDHIFQYIAREQSDNLEFSIVVSFVELYLGKCRDLLHKSGDHGANLELRENAQKVFYVKDLSMHAIGGVMAGMELVEEGLSRREVKSTKLNNDSSRSHAIFSMHIRRHDKVQDTRTEAKLMLVDLAGSERQSKTEAEGAALAEGSAINGSLTALGTVIDCLVKQKPHIPYRSSALTQLLKDGLGGGSRTLIIGTISPSSTNVQETMSTLRFVDRAKQIKNKPRLQMDPKDARIHELTEELTTLKKRFGLISETGEELGGGGGGDDDDGGEEGFGDNDASKKKRYAKSFEGEIEALKTRVEELEVQLTDAREAAERATEDLSTVEGRHAKHVAGLQQQLAETKDEVRQVVEMQQLEHSVAGGSVQEQLNELQRLCTNFVATLDPDGAVLGKGAAALKKGDVVPLETLSNAFNHIESNFVVSGAAGTPMKQQQQSGGGGDVSPPAGGGLLSRRRSFCSPGSLQQQQQQSPATTTTTTTASPGGGGGGQQQQQQQTSSSSSPVAASSTASVAAAAAAAAAVADKAKLDDDVLKECLKRITKASTGDANDKKEMKDALEDILMRQRQLVHRSMFDVLKQQESGGERSPGGAGAGAGGGLQAETSSVLAAYDHANDEIERLTDSVVKQKQLAQKAKQIADKRAEEAAALKHQVVQLKEEAAKKHMQHAAELEQVQSNLLQSHSKKMEKVLQSHQKDLKAERKQRDAIAAKIDAAERERDDALQKYDVLVMEHEQLIEAFEQQKVDTMRMMREGQRPGGSSTTSSRGAGSSAGMMMMEDTLNANSARDSKNLQKLRTRVNEVSSSTNSLSPTTPIATPRSPMPGQHHHHPNNTATVHSLPPMPGGGGGQLPPLGGPLPPKRF